MTPDQELALSLLQAAAAPSPAPAPGTGVDGPERMRVVRGNPSAEEAAAVEAVLAASAAEWAETKHRLVLDRPSTWMERAKGLRPQFDLP